MAEVAERSTVEILKAARERISDPSRWTKGKLSDGVTHGYAPPAVMSEATCWCAMGAIMCEAPDEPSFRAAANYFEGASKFNDRHSHAEVLEHLDRAVQLAEQEAGK